MPEFGRQGGVGSPLVFVLGWVTTVAVDTAQFDIAKRVGMLDALAVGAVTVHASTDPLYGGVGFCVEW